MLDPWRSLLKALSPRARVSPRGRHRKCYHAQLESLEDRLLLAGKVFTVINTNDNATDGGSLLWAITQVNADGGQDTINFNIGTGGAKQITPATLPTINVPVTIDATTQPGFSGLPLITLDGTNAGANGIGLTIGSQVTVRGLILVHWQKEAIELTKPGNAIATSQVATGCRIEDNQIGIDANNQKQPNEIGILIDSGAKNNTIGGSTFMGGPQGTTTVNSRNVISGNSDRGILIAPGSGNVIYNDYIGTNLNGTGPVGNGTQGIEVISDTAPDPKDPNNANLLSVGNKIGVLAATQQQTLSLYNVISGNALAGVWITGVGASANVVAGNDIGTDKTGENVGTGTTKMGNGGAGVDVRHGANTNWIGLVVSTDGNGVITDAANVISGNAFQGILIFDPGTNVNRIFGNFIGTHRNGVQGVGNDGNPMGNGLSGIAIYSGSQNIVGGLDLDGDRNIISGNGNDGIYIDGAAGTGIYRNNIGTNKTGDKVKTVSLVNGGNGVNVTNGATGTLVKQNLIYFNTKAGVVVTDNTTTGTRIQDPNSILGNGALGIDLGGDGVTQNTPGGPHAGPNLLQNFPVLTSATVSASSTTIVGTLNSTPLSAFTLEFFSNATPDPSGYGQGEQYLGTTSVITDNNGNASFTVSFPSSFGSYVAATATDMSGNTSEFSADVADQQLGAPTVTAVSPTSGPTAGGTTVTITGSNFVDVSSVQFGGGAASFTVNSPTQITATSPAHAAGTVDVTVTNPAGTSAANPGDRYTYVVPVPVVTGVSPNSGPTSGGTTVTISGTGFTGTTLVSFGSTPAAGYGQVTDTRITVLSPAHAGGIVDITVTTPGGTSSTSPRDQFSFGVQLPQAASALAAAAAPVGPAPALSAPARPVSAFAAAAALAAAGTPPAGPATDTSAGPRPAPVPVGSRDDRSFGQSTPAAVRDASLAAGVPSRKRPAPAAAEVLAADLVPPDTDPLQPPA